MFYTRTEIGERLGWTFQCNGIGAIIGSFLGFGVSHLAENSRPARLAPLEFCLYQKCANTYGCCRWQWFMIIISIATLLVSIAFWVWFPDNPATARFLSQDEKVNVVHRIKLNQNGIETKVWKKAQ